MSVYALKSKFQALLRPLVQRLASRGISANQVTLLACALSLLIGLILSLCLFYGGMWGLLLLPIFLFVRMAMNAIDGMLAREHAQQSALGGYLNELTDVVSDAALYLPLLLLPDSSSFLVWLLVLQAALSEFAGVLGQVHGNGRRYDGPMGKSDRALWLGLFAIIWFAFPQTLAYSNLVFLIINLALTYTIYRRVRNGLRPQE